MAETDELAPLLLYDGHCGLCDRTVQFTLERSDSVRFTPLQSERGRRILEGCGMAAGEYESVVLVDGDGCHTHSTAALRLCRHLKAAWPLLSVLLLVPRPLRDAVYRFVARRRYRWFGTFDQCRIPAPGEQHRFLD